MTHDPIIEVFQAFQFFNAFLDCLQSKFQLKFINVLEHYSRYKLYIQAARDFQCMTRLKHFQQKPSSQLMLM